MPSDKVSVHPRKPCRSPDALTVTQQTPSRYRQRDGVCRGDGVRFSFIESAWHRCCPGTENAPCIDGCGGRFCSALEPPIGIEPMTYSLRVRIGPIVACQHCGEWLSYHIGIVRQRSGEAMKLGPLLGPQPLSST